MSIQKYKLKPGVILALSCLLGFSVQSQAQAPDLMWATNIGGTGTEISNDIAIDPAGNMYIAGYFASDAIDFDPLGGTGVILSTKGGDDGFISKMDPNGHLVWVKQIGNTGTSGTEAVLAIALDDTGNVYVTGYFNGTADFDPGTGAADTFFMTRTGTSNNNDIFVLKLDNNGNFVWAVSMGGTGNERGLAMDVDRAGNVYVAGAFNTPSPGAFFGTVDTLITTRNAAGTSNSVDAFICRVNASGDISWVKQIGGYGADALNGVVADDYGNVFITGGFVDTARFGDAYTLIGNPGNNQDGYVARMDAATGNFIWIHGIGGPEGGDRGEKIVTDNMGHIYITGAFRGTANFDPNGSYPLTATPNKVVGGQEVDDIFVAKWDTAGNFIWTNSWGGGTADYGQDLVLDGIGNIYVVCDYGDTVDFGNFNLASLGNDVAILKLDTAGSLQWAGGVGGNSFDHVYGVAADGLGNVYITGRYQSHLNTDFDPGPGVFPMPTTMNAAGTSGTIDMFVMRLYACVNVAGVTINGPDSICPGNTYTYAVGPVPGAVSYEWDFPASWTVSGSGNSMTVTVDDNTGNVSVSVNGLCDTALIDMPVVLSMPPLQITVDENILGTISDAYLSWQWYKDGASIDGATDPTYTVLENATYSVVVTGPDGCTDSAAYTVTNVSVSELSGAGDIRVYPNPATGVVHIDAAGMASVSVKGLDGRTLLLHKATGNRDIIDISGLIPGIYFLEITDHSGAQIGLEKLVKTAR